MKVRERLEALIRERGISQVRLARLMGEGENWVNNRIRGVTPIKADEIPRFAAALGVSPCAFFEEVKPAPTTVRLDNESIERIGEAVSRRPVELAPESVERIAVELAHRVAPATAEAVARKLQQKAEQPEPALRPQVQERVERIVRRKVAEFARRWEDLTEEEQAGFWEWLDQQREEQARQEVPEGEAEGV